MFKRIKKWFLSKFAVKKTHIENNENKYDNIGVDNMLLYEIAKDIRNCKILNKKQLIFLKTITVDELIDIIHLLNMCNSVLLEKCIGDCEINRIITQNKRDLTQNNREIIQYEYIE